MNGTSDYQRRVITLKEENNRLKDENARLRRRIEELEQLSSKEKKIG